MSSCLPDALDPADSTRLRGLCRWNSSTTLEGAAAELKQLSHAHDNNADLCCPTPTVDACSPPGHRRKVRSRFIINRERHRPIPVKALRWVAGVIVTYGLAAVILGGRERIKVRLNLVETQHCGTGARAMPWAGQVIGSVFLEMRQMRGSQQPGQHRRRCANFNDTLVKYVLSGCGCRRM